MESTRHLRGMQPAKDQEELYVRAGFAARSGQLEAWKDAATTTADSRLIVLPTGYGKTMAAAGYYLTLRARSIVNRLLWVVPTTALLRQLVPEAPHQLIMQREPTIAEAIREKFMQRCGEAVVVEPSPRLVRYLREGRAEIFVTTYHQITSNPGFFRLEILAGRPGWKWMIVWDEAHHLAEDGRWGELAASLPRAFSLYMTATPLRTDRRILAGVPAKRLSSGEWTYDAAVEVTYRQAFEERAIRLPRAHVGHYFVDVVDAEGKHERLTTERLAEEAVTDFSAYEIRRGLRYEGRYLASMIAEALDCLYAKRARHPGQHQMLVFAMSSAHAEFVCREFLNNPETGIEGCADWISTHRQESENQAILSRFNAGDLPVLVQVDKAGEGFDNPRCSVLLFLHLIKSNAKLAQQVGRGLRRNYALAYEDDVLDVFASADTAVAKFIHDLEIEAGPYRERPELDDRVVTDDRTPRLPDLAVIDAERYDIETVYPNGSGPVYPDYIRQAAEALRQEFRALAGREIGDEESLRLAEKLSRHFLVASHLVMPRRQPLPEAQRLAYYQEQVKRALASVARLTVKRLSAENGGGFDRRLLGAVKHEINRRWAMEFGRHDVMVADDFQKKYQWLQRLFDRVERGEIPLWLRNAAET